MGTTIQKLAESVSLIASAQTWIEGKATQQLIKTSQLNDMLHVAGMPDLHPGRGYPIGAAFFTRNTLYPALVGNDIGCGMGLWQTSVKLAKVNVEKLAKRLIDVEDPLDSTWGAEIATLKRQKRIETDDYDKALGTIGGGNHFAEFQAIDDVVDKATFAALGLDKSRLQLLVHSGSRGLGQSILVDHVSRFSHNGLKPSDSDFSDYLEKHDEAVRWAELNRDLIAKRFLQAIRESGQPILDVNHNLVVPKSIDGQQGWLHRKGATPSDQGCVVIPGSRGDFSYLVRPCELGKLHDVSLFSLAHGAGRKWQRGDCQGRLSHKYKKEDLLRTALGSRVICGNKELLYDEAPQAYKKCASVVGDLVDAGLVSIVATLRPVLTFKTQGECGK